LTPLFTLEHARVGYDGRAVLADVSLTISAGERVGIVGPSGAGKSTLLRALYAQMKERTALVPQDCALVKQLSVYHNVFIGRLHRHGAVYNLLNLLRPWPARVSAVSSLLRELALTDQLFASVGELSGGQQQRTAVARALYQGGEALLADEPVSAVDVLQARQVLELIQRRFATVVLVLHDVELALEFTTRIIGLRAGRIVIDRPAVGLSVEELDGLYRPLCLAEPHSRRA
jgi:phosphonate transport system ATP-binding protein